MTYTRKIYGFCVAILCAFFMIGCSAIKETSDIAVELDISALLSGNSGLRQVLDGDDNIELDVSALISTPPGSQGGDFFHRFETKKIFYPKESSAKIEFKDLEIDEKYYVLVTIYTGGYSVYSEESGPFVVKAGTNVVPLTMKKTNDNSVKLAVDTSDVNIPLSGSYYSYILFQLNNGAGTTYYGVTKITDGNKSSVKHEFSNYPALRKTTAQVFYIITTEEVTWSNSDENGNNMNKTSLDGLTYTVLKESDSKIYYVVPDKEFSLELKEVATGGQSVGVSTLDLPVIKAVSENESCTITSLDSTYEISVTSGDPFVSFNVKTKDGNDYDTSASCEWFLNGTSVSIDTSYNLNLSNEENLNVTDLNTLMLIVSKDGAIQSAIWQFSITQ